MNKYYLGKRSKENLSTCTDRIQMVVKKVISLGIMDLSVTEGARGKTLQDKYFETGKSKVKWPNSKHNILKEGDKSYAVDIVPYINGKSSYKLSHCCCLAMLIIGVGAMMGVKIRWGGNWDMDGEPITDQDFQDLVHFEEVL